LIEARSEQKSTRLERKSHDKNYEMITQAKKIWEQLRRGDIGRDEQKQLMEKIMKIIGGKVQDVRIYLLYNKYTSNERLHNRSFSNTMPLVSSKLVLKKEMLNREIRLLKN
jgi:hypothetical protein